MNWVSNSCWEYTGKSDGNMTGKYLFFSSNRDELKRIAETEIAEHGFQIAKVSCTPASEYVLCLYWKNDSRKRELADRYKHLKTVKYRYWKSDESTRAGIYSQQHLKAIGAKT